MKYHFTLLLLLALLPFSTQARADITLPAVIASGAVLQRQMPIPIWGWDNPGQEITVTLDGKTQSTKTDDQGFWILKLPAREAGGPYALTIKGSSTAELTDILVGEVWFCSGQSNMALEMNGTSGFKEELAGANRPTLRTLNFPHSKNRLPNPRQWASKYPLAPIADPKTAPPAWTPSSPESLAKFSGVAYHFGKSIQTDINVPVGLIHSSLGGSRIQAWIGASGAESNPIFKGEIDREKIAIDTYERELQAYNQKNPKGQKATKPATTQPATSQPAAAKPASPPVPTDRFSAASPSSLFNGMVAPIAPYAIRGALWYQGEANAKGADRYEAYLVSLIKNWRAVWGQGDFPFLVVQLPNFKEPSWPYQREAQYLAVEQTPNAHIAVTIDLGKFGSIHPSNKRDVGARLALIALESVYKKEIQGHSPVFSGLKIQGDKAIVTFTNASDGLVTKNSKPPTLFEIAGADGIYAPAQAQIQGDSITLVSDTVKTPQFVRFAWSPGAEGFNLYNKQNLPVMPFRTDKALFTLPAPPATQPAPATLK